MRYLWAIGKFRLHGVRKQILPVNIVMKEWYIWIVTYTCRCKFIYTGAYELPVQWYCALSVPDSRVLKSALALYTRVCCFLPFCSVH